MIRLTNYRQINIRIDLYIIQIHTTHNTLHTTQHITSNMNTYKRMDEATRKLASISIHFYNSFPIASMANEVMVKSENITFFNFNMVYPKEANIRDHIRGQIISYVIAFPRFRKIACSTLFLRDIGEHCKIFTYYPEKVHLSDEQIEIRDMFLDAFNEIAHDFNTARGKEIFYIPLTSDRTLRCTKYVLKIAALYQTLYDYLELSSQGKGGSFEELYATRYSSMMVHIRNAQAQRF